MSEITAENMERLKAIARKHNIEVVRITQSPLNRVRWCLDLACGHETWITATRRPKQRVAACLTCNPPRTAPPACKRESEAE